MNIYTYGIGGLDFPKATKTEIYNYFREKSEVEFDTETTGFDCHKDELVCFQLGDNDTQFVIHPSKLLEFKPVLEKRLVLGHNIKFDLKFLYKNGIWPRRVYDTFLAEGIIYCGIPSEKKNLAHIAKKRLDVTLDKSIRDEIFKERLTKRVVEYAASDVKWLGKLRDAQLIDLQRLGLEKALDMENQFVLCLAYIEYCGFRLDREKWLNKHSNDVKIWEERKKLLDDWVIDNKLERFINPQMDLFSTDVIVNINWASPKQVIELFQYLKIPVEKVEKGVVKLTVDARHLSKYRKKFEIIEPYLKYKEAEKVVGTYGESFIKQIHPITGRLHTQFKQIMDTGRLSCGGKDKSTGEEYINFQNIPREKETRECFIPKEGNKLIIGDFSGQESVILTNRSEEPNLIQFYENGGGDMHAFVASKMYKELIGLSFAEIKEKHPEKRYNAKTAGLIEKNIDFIW